MMKNLASFLVLVTLCLAVHSNAVIGHKLLRNGHRHRKPLPIDKDHGVIQEVTERENHEAEVDRLRKREQNLHTRIPHKRQVIVKKNIPKVKIATEPGKCKKIHHPAVCVGTSKFYYGTSHNR
eukprot:g3596.t1